MLETLVTNKYYVDLVTTIIAMLLANWLGGGGELGRTTTRQGLVTVVLMNFNISLLFIQYFGDLERIKIIWGVVWFIFFIAIVTAYALGKGGFDVSMGKGPSFVRKAGSPLISGIIVGCVYLAMDNFFEYLRPFVMMAF